MFSSFAPLLGPALYSELGIAILPFDINSQTLTDEKQSNRPRIRLNATFLMLPFRSYARQNRSGG
jgi:hypothetical protein